MNEAVPAKYRDINTITSEIRMLQQQSGRLVLEYSIEMGRRLCEAKELLAHGEWGRWLKEEVDFSQSTANNLMRIFREYGDPQGNLFGASANSQTLGNLSFSQALSLLKVPESEREDFVKAHHAEELSSRELDRLIAENRRLKEEKEKAEAVADDAKAMEELAVKEQNTLEAEIEKADAEISKLTKELENEKKEAVKAAEKLKEEANKAQRKAKEKDDALKKLKEAHEKELKKLKEDTTVPPETLEKLKAAAKAESEAAIRKAEREAQEAAGRAAELEKQLKAASPELAEFKLLFELVQTDYNKLHGALIKISMSDKDKGDKLTAAVKAVLGKFLEAL